MPAVVVVGGQWGDEGKGRIVDMLAQKAQVIARYSAGNNAGHTVINHLGEFRLHLIPAGIFYDDKLCIIGNGVVIDPAELLEEIEGLKSRGVSVERLHVSDRAHVLMPYHKLLDRLEEEKRGDMAIGTTGRGVGPAFVDKVGRSGIRMGDLVDADALRHKLATVLPGKNGLLEDYYHTDGLNMEEVYATYAEHGRKLKPFVMDTVSIVHEALERGDTVLLEGAQGALLDLDAGTYEFVTSSVPSSLAGGATVGIGIGPTQIQQVVGVYKAYTTRVGNGPMPTELFDEMGEWIRESASEYGATTGRPRRCGWFDAVAARYSARVNGLTSAVLTRLDVLDSLPSIQVCTAYRLDGSTTTAFPASSLALARCEPILEEMPGWQAETTSARRFEDLPKAAQEYVAKIEGLLGCPIDIVSVGPEREQAIIRKPLM